MGFRGSKLSKVRVIQVDFMVNQMEVTRQIVEALGTCVDKRKFNIGPVCNWRSIEITGRRNLTNIYIRVELRDGIWVNFSNVTIDEKLRHTGLFTSLVKSVSELPIVSGVVIGGVCTHEMVSWCNKNGFVTNDFNCCDYFRQFR